MLHNIGVVFSPMSLMPSLTMARTAFLSCPYPSIQASVSAPQKVQTTLFDVSLYTVDIPSKKKEEKVGRKEERRKNNVLRTKGKKRKKEQDEGQDNKQENLFDSYEYCQTEYLLYCLWDGLKKQDRDIFFEAIELLHQYLTDEQFDVLIAESKWYFSLEDKGWLLTVLQGNKIAPFSLLFPCHHQMWGLLNLFPHFPYPPSGRQVYPIFYLLIMALFSWANN